MSTPQILLLASALALNSTALAVQPAEVLQPFKLALKQTLVDALAAGPAAAIEACQLKAPLLADQYSRNGVQVGRASHRLRNPVNAPQPWVADVINDYLADGATLAPVTRQLADGRMGYAEPIITQPLCLACHGSELSSDVRRELQQRYPQDEATGFEAGELRGVFWVTWTP